VLEPRDEPAFREAVNAFKTSDPTWDFAFEYEERGDFAAYVRKLDAWSRGEEVPEGFVPNTYLVAVSGREIVGRLSIRHRLNSVLERTGGHVGYGVVPAYRRRGYGRQIQSRALSSRRT
jgi:predicted acetyltransferase